VVKKNYSNIFFYLITFQYSKFWAYLRGNRTYLFSTKFKIIWDYILSCFHSRRLQL